MTTTTIKIKAKDLKKLDLNEGSVLILTVPTDTPFNVMNEAAKILEIAGERVIGFRPQVVVMPDVYEIEKLSMYNLYMLQARVNGLIAHHTRRIETAKKSGDA